MPFALLGASEGGRSLFRKASWSIFFFAGVHFSSSTRVLRCDHAVGREASIARCVFPGAFRSKFVVIRGVRSVQLMVVKYV
jgi:hypothetical protein